MQKNHFARQRVMFPILACAFVLFMGAVLYSSSSVVEFTAIGKVESIYRDRVSLKILQIVGSESADLSIATGSWISFDLPREYRDKRSRRDRGEIIYGTVIEAELIGNIATEYELKTDKAKTETSTATSSAAVDEELKKTVPTVLLWTAQSVKKIKNANTYLPAEERKDKKGRRKKDKKPAEPVKVWTQEETVRGEILVKKEKVFIKEDRLGKRDKGLQILSEDWAGKLMGMSGSRVVLHGTTHRTNVSSGTIEIKSLMKVTPK